MCKMSSLASQTLSSVRSFGGTPNHYTAETQSHLTSAWVARTTLPTIVKASILRP